jgi:AmmeMemoRadiSam system protein A
MVSEKQKVGVDLGLSNDEKQELLRIARVVIERRTRGETMPELTPLTDRLNEPRGAFVTVEKRGMLRGCVGSLEVSKPLYKTVAEMAEEAAFHDLRFRPIGPDELPYLKLEISVLTPMEKVSQIEEILIGIHGLMISLGERSGLLLPQVAVERNWDRRTFLEETCRKAGLSRDAWKDEGSEIYVFSADVF